MDTKQAVRSCSLSVVRTLENQVVKPPSQGSAQWPSQATLSCAASGNLARRGERVSRARVRGDRHAGYCGGSGPFSCKSLQLLPGETRNPLFLSGQFSRSHDRGARQGSPDKNQCRGKAAHGDRFAFAVRARRSRGFRRASFDDGVAAPPTTLFGNKTRQI